jgi:hypothetical protein
VVDGPLDDDVDPGLEGAGPDQQRVPPAQVGADDAGHLEGVLVVGHRRDLGVVEDEVERPADVGVGVAQAGQHRGAGDVDPLRTRRVDRGPAAEDAGDAVALQQDVPVEGALDRVARAGDDPGVGEEDARRHVPPLMSQLRRLRWPA